MVTPMPSALPASEPVSDADGRIDNPRAIRDGFAPEVSVRPLKLHTPMVEGALGGHAFSADFARYLASVKPRLVVMWQLRVRYWWASSYGRQRVRRDFVSRFGKTTGETNYRVALIIASGFWGEEPYTRLMTETGHTARWIAGMGILGFEFAKQHSTRAA
jgi:hypothetical protein